MFFNLDTEGRPTGLYVLDFISYYCRIHQDGGSLYLADVLFTREVFGVVYPVPGVVLDQSTCLSPSDRSPPYDNARCFFNTPSFKTLLAPNLIIAVVIKRARGFPGTQALTTSLMCR